MYTVPGPQLTQLLSQPYIQGVQGVEAVEAFGGGEILAFGRMQGGGMVQLSAQPGIDGNFFAPLITKNVREVSDKLFASFAQWVKELGRRI